MDCMNCNKPIEASGGKRKRLYCSDRCRMAYKRKLAKMALKSEQNVKTNKPNIKSEQRGVCKYCGVKLDWGILVCCLACATSRPPNYDNSLRFKHEAYIYTGTMTDYESEHYKPANELGQGEYNPVSKPGDEHYKETG